MVPFSSKVPIWFTALSVSTDQPDFVSVLKYLLIPGKRTEKIQSSPLRRLFSCIHKKRRSAGRPCCYDTALLLVLHMFKLIREKGSFTSAGKSRGRPFVPLCVCKPSNSHKKETQSQMCPSAAHNQFSVNKYSMLRCIQLCKRRFLYIWKTFVWLPFVSFTSL